MVPHFDRFMNSHFFVAQQLALLRLNSAGLKDIGVRNPKSILPSPPPFSSSIIACFVHTLGEAI
jgi:hypothetical protein